MSMDAVEYVKQRKRMCDYYTHNNCCSKCPAFSCVECGGLNGIPKMVPIVEQWARAHPVKTRQREFLKQWPDAEIDGDGLLAVAPCQLNLELIHGGSATDCESRGVCTECRREFWMQEVK